MYTHGELYNPQLGCITVIIVFHDIQWISFCLILAKEISKHCSHGSLRKHWNRSYPQGYNFAYNTNVNNVKRNSVTVNINKITHGID